MPVTVEIRDSGATGVVSRMENIAQVMAFGVLEDAAPYPDGTPVAVVAAVHEFGAGDVPQRSFLRGYVDGGGAKDIGAAGEDAIGDVVDGAAADTVSEAMGEVAVDGVQSLIEAGISPDLSASTEANPERDTRYIPLLDTGHLRDSIDWTEVQP